MRYLSDETRVLLTRALERFEDKAGALTADEDWAEHERVKRTEELAAVRKRIAELREELEGEHVTAGGGLGINCGGLMIVLPLRTWHALAAERGVQKEPK